MSASAKAQRLRNRMPAIDPDAPPPPVPPAPSATAPKALESVPAPDPAPDEVEASEAPEAAPGPTTRRTIPKQPPAVATDDVEEDEKVRSGYRSFYVEDDIFTRFRAAIYWSSRRHDADEDVPINMSAGVSEYMERTAAELEKRFNDGEPFRSPPVVQRKKRKTRKTEK